VAAQLAASQEGQIDLVNLLLHMNAHGALMNLCYMKKKNKNV
jgi:hypothetical protein